MTGSSLTDRLRAAVRDRVGGTRNSSQRRREDDASASEQAATAPQDEEDGADVTEGLLTKYADRWDEPSNSMYRYVVLPPEDGPASIRWCSTLAEVRSRLELWYEDEGGEGEDGRDEETDRSN